MTREKNQATATQSQPLTQPEQTRELFEALGNTISADLLIHALTHRSFAHEHPGMPNNERLEFLGDAVLELVVTETLFTLHPSMTEGQLAKIRAKAVSEDTLAHVARTELKLGRFVLLGHGEQQDGGADKDSILCDTVECLIGAVFVEHGIEGARVTVHRLIDGPLAEVTGEGPALDWKTSLTVKAHRLGLGEPHYRMEVAGPQYAQLFTAHVFLDAHDTVPNDTAAGDADSGRAPVGTGTGSSMRKAQLAAARDAWHALDDPPHADRFTGTGPSGNTRSDGTR